MIRIGIIDGGKIEAVKELLRGLVMNRPIEICDARKEPVDILIVNKAPLDGVVHCSPKIVIANSDDGRILQFVASLEAQIITYGLNPKAAITASSCSDDIYVICVQRAMVTIDDEPILPREFSVKIQDCEGFDDIVMGSVAAALICGADFK